MSDKAVSSICEVAMVAILAIFIAILFVGCTPQEQAKVQPIVADVTALCSTAMALAPLAGPDAAYIIAACGTEQAVAAVAANPATQAALQTLIARIPH